jgi:hypothetical protein
LNFFGFDEFSYLASDGQSESIATVAIQVASINDPPVAADDDFTVSSGLPGIAVLIPPGALWRYLDNGTHPPVAWRGLEFDDSAWKQGRAQLGYGEGDEATVISFGPDINQRHITTYFRTTFEVADPLEIVALLIDVLRDDGAAIYLNGISLLGTNISTIPEPGQLAFNAVTGVDESRFFPYPTLQSALRAGPNVLAVELHQANSTSNDLSFDLRLTGAIRSRPTGNVLANDFDIEADVLTVSRFVLPQNGSITLLPDGNFYYIPYVGYAGTDSFTYFASDGPSRSAPTTVTITVEPPISTPCSAADLDGDGQVTKADFSRLVENYGSTVSPMTSGDLDGNGRVGVADLPRLRDLLGQSCAPSPAPAVAAAVIEPVPRVAATRLQTSVQRDRATDAVFDAHSRGATAHVKLPSTQPDRATSCTLRLYARRRIE